MHDDLAESRPAFLASVANADEAQIALQSGAAIIDCKNPLTGALGALAPSEIREIVAHVGGRAPVSATLGDLPADGAVLVNAAQATAMLGVDVIKIGFFGDGGARPAIRALREASLGEARLVAVLMADRAPDFSLAADFAAAGFAAAMLDTADKASGALPEVLGRGRLVEFVSLMHAHGLLAGFAGSLRLTHIDSLARFGPDILGFRGALCAGGRASALDRELCASVARAIFEAASSRRAAAATA